MDEGDGSTLFCFRICHFATDWPRSFPSTWTRVSKGKPLRVVCHLKPTAMRPVTWKHLNESLHSKIGGRRWAKTIGEWDVRRRFIKPDSPPGHATDSASACLSPGSMVTLWRAELADKINSFTRRPVRVFESAFCHICCRGWIGADGIWSSGRGPSHVPERYESASNKELQLRFLMTLTEWGENQ